MHDETKASHQQVLDLQNQSKLQGDHDVEKDEILNTIDPEDKDMANFKVDEDGVLDLKEDLIEEFEGKDQTELKIDEK